MSASGIFFKRSKGLIEMMRAVGLSYGRQADPGYMSLAC